MICREGTVGASERAQCREVADWCRVQTRDKEQTRDRSQSVDSSLQPAIYQMLSQKRSVR